MAQNSKIEWTDHTANLWWGCQHVHAGCDNCYAETFANRYHPGHWGKGTTRLIIKGFFPSLAKYQKEAAAKGEIHRVFVGSMMDIFEKPMNLVDAKGEGVFEIINGPLGASEIDVDTERLRRRFFMNITDGLYPNLLFLLLTKRPSNINKYIPESWKENPPDNVMFGTSPVDQVTFDTLVPQLLQVNGKRFLSMEPQLESIHLANKFTNQELQGIHWIIQGGESGHRRRPFDIYWAYSIYHQCVVNEIPYFFKQIDKVIPVPDNLKIHEFPNHYSIK